MLNPGTKAFLLVSLLISGIGMGASPAWAQLTAGQTREILFQIDKTCGDSWCENGSVADYRFHSLACDEIGNCELRYDLSLYGDENLEDVRDVPAVCRLPGFESKVEFEASSSGALRAELTDEAFEQLSRCFDENLARALGGQ